MKTFIAIVILLFAFSLYKTYAITPPDEKVEQAAALSVSDEKVKELQAASRSGDRIAQYKLGLLYARGGGNLKQDYKKAHELLLAAAMQGVPKAQYHLGEMYVLGDGVEEDYQEATVWFWLATSLGDKYSEKRLRAITTRISAEQLANAKARVERLWKEIPHDLKVERTSLH